MPCCLINRITVIPIARMLTHQGSSSVSSGSVCDWCLLVFMSTL